MPVLRLPRTEDFALAGATPGRPSELSSPCERAWRTVWSAGPV